MPFGQAFGQGFQIGQAERAKPFLQGLPEIAKAFGPALEEIIQPEKVKMRRTMEAFEKGYIPEGMAKKLFSARGLPPELFEDMVKLDVPGVGKMIPAGLLEMAEGQAKHRALLHQLEEERNRRSIQLEGFNRQGLPQLSRVMPQGMSGPREQVPLTLDVMPQVAPFAREAGTQKRFDDRKENTPPKISPQEAAAITSLKALQAREEQLADEAKKNKDGDIAAAANALTEKMVGLAMEFPSLAKLLTGNAKKAYASRRPAAPVTQAAPPRTVPAGSFFGD